MLVMLGLMPAAAQSGLAWDVPAGWIEVRAPSTMRAAEFTLPRADGDPEDASLVVFYFGGQGGSVDANLDRWLSQMAQPDGRRSRDVASIDTRTVSGLPLTVLDVSGTYVAEVRPGAPERFNKPGFRLIAAVAETPDGPYFFRLVGPAKTTARWLDSIEVFFGSLRYE